MTQSEAVSRLYVTYNEYGITKEVLNSVFDDGINNHHFTLQETYNLLRMSLAYEYGEREYFSLFEIASMLGMNEEEVMSKVERVKKGNRTIMNGFKL